MRRILLATDFSERSDRALRRSVFLAKAVGAAIDVVHSVDDDRPRRIVDREVEEAGILLAELVRSLATTDAVKASARVFRADPFAGIARAVNELGPDLLVLGPHRREILRDAFIGTTAERTIRSVDCPVLMVNGPPTGPYRHALLTTDLSDLSRNSLRRFESLGIAAGIGRSVLNVFDAPALRLATSGSIPLEDRKDYLEDQRAAAMRSLSAFMATEGGMGAELIVRHEESTVANDILRAATDLRADLIVVSTRGRGKIARLLLGSVAERVLRSSAVDVLAVPPARCG